MKPIIRIPLKYGLVAGILGSVLITVLYYAGKHPLLIPIIIDYRLILLPLFLFFAIKEFRDRTNGGHMQFWQGMTAGFALYAFLGVFVGLYILLFDQITSGEFRDQFVEISLGQLQEFREKFIEGIGQEAYDNSLNTMPLTTIFDLVSDYFIKTCALGILFTIIISVILRRQPN